MNRTRRCILFSLSMMSVFCIVVTVNVGIDDGALGDIYSSRELRDIEEMLIDDTAQDVPESLELKEKEIRDALLRSTSNKSNQKKLSQVVPILRSMSREQRLAMAALIATQATARSGEELDLKQVSKNFPFRFTQDKNDQFHFNIIVEIGPTSNQLLFAKMCSMKMK